MMIKRFFALLLCAAFVPLWGTEVKTDKLSYDEVVAFILGQSLHYRLKGTLPYNKLDDSYKHRLIQVIKEKKSNRMTTQVINGVFMVLGYIASKDDIPFLTNYIQESIQKIKNSPYKKSKKIDYKTLNSLFRSFAMTGYSDCIAIMIARKVPGAENIYEKYGGLETWDAIGCSNLIKGYCAGNFAQRVFDYTNSILAQKRLKEAVSLIEDVKNKKLKPRKQTLYDRTMSGENYMSSKLIPEFVTEMKRKNPKSFQRFGINVEFDEKKSVDEIMSRVKLRN